MATHYPVGVEPFSPGQQDIMSPSAGQEVMSPPAVSQSTIVRRSSIPLLGTKKVGDSSDVSDQFTSIRVTTSRPVSARGVGSQIGSRRASQQTGKKVSDFVSRYKWPLIGALTTLAIAVGVVAAVMMLKHPSQPSRVSQDLSSAKFQIDHSATNSQMLYTYNVYTQKSTESPVKVEINYRSTVPGQFIFLKLKPAAGSLHPNVTLKEQNFTGPIQLPHSNPSLPSWNTISVTRLIDFSQSSDYVLTVDLTNARQAVDVSTIKVTSDAKMETTPFNKVPITLPGRIKANEYDSNGATAKPTSDEWDNEQSIVLKEGQFIDYSTSLDGTANIMAMSIHYHSETVKGTLAVRSNGKAWITDFPLVKSDPKPANWTSVVITKSLDLVGDAVFRIYATKGDLRLGNIVFAQLPRNREPQPTYRPSELSRAMAVSNINRNIPGTIDLMMYDDYYDTTPQNLGGAIAPYKGQTAVDITVTSDGSYYVSYNEIGEWQSYQVNVIQDASYVITFKYATAADGRSIRIFIDEVNKCDIQLPNTGGWETFKTATCTTNINAGSHVLKLYHTSGQINDDQLSFTYYLPAISYNIPGTIEAEYYDKYYDTTPQNLGGATPPNRANRATDAVDVSSYANGYRFYVSYISVGEWINFPVTVAQSGTYKFDMQYAATADGKRVDVVVNNQLICKLLGDSTGGWENFKKTSCQGSLNAGAQTLLLGMVTAEINIDFVAVTFVSSTTTTSTTATSLPQPATPTGPQPFQDKVSTIPGMIELENYDTGGSGVSYWDSTPGNSGGAYRQDDVDIYQTGTVVAIGGTADGEWLSYTVNVATNGLYSFEWRYSTGSSGQKLHVFMNDQLLISNYILPHTGALDNWAQIKFDRTLNVPNPGQKTSKLKIMWASWDMRLDWLKISRWNLKFQDDFDSIDLNKWSYEVNCWGGGNGEKQCYTNRPQNLFIQNGELHIHAQKETYTGSLNGCTLNNDNSCTWTQQYTSGRIVSLPTNQTPNSWRYGRISARMKLPSGRGLWPAFWMLPTDWIYGTWASSGEIDIMELRGQYPNVIMSTLHFSDRWPYNVYEGSGETTFPFDFSQDYHVFTCEWDPYVMNFYLDDNLYFSKNMQQSFYRPRTQSPLVSYPPNNAYGTAFLKPYDQRFHIIFNLAVGGNFLDGPDPWDSWSQPDLIVDWVTVHQRDSY